MTMLFKRRVMRMFRSFGKMSSDPFKPSNKVEVGKYALLSIPVATFGLGTWQIQRQKWKLKLIEELESKRKILPVDLIENLENLSNLEYRSVYVRGVFDHSREVYVGPRSYVDNSSKSSSTLFSIPPPSGYHVVTPFKLTDKNMTILVNRGWVTKSRMLPKTRPEGQIEGEVDLVGTVRFAEKKPLFYVKYVPGCKVFPFRDVDAIAAKLNTSPIFLDADRVSAVHGGPLAGQTRVALRNEHTSYIITWYSLSAITAWMWYLKYVRHVPLI